MISFEKCVRDIRLSLRNNVLTNSIQIWYVVNLVGVKHFCEVSSCSTNLKTRFDGYNVQQMNTRTQNVHSPSMLTYTAPSCCDLSRCSAPLLLYFILIVLAFSNWNHPSNLAFVPHDLAHSPPLCFHNVCLLLALFISVW